MEPGTEPNANEVPLLVEQIGALLARRHEAIQGAVLADLLAIWLAGHFPAEIREVLLEAHLNTVRALIVPNEKIILERLGMKIEAIHRGVKLSK